ncbi:helix-turn-helix transcriptional regulator [Spongiibacter marinus]|uniref:helix-turn-helix domain-containing protein n=1 Tax=Spongiibacter marinus TaxID=354246 RepID=UPI0030B832CA
MRSGFIGTCRRLNVSNFATFFIVSTIETMKPSAYSQHYDKLRTWLRAKREEQGLSLRAVSTLVGRHHSVLGKMEQDRRRIDIIEYVEYCRALGVDPHEGLELVLTSMALSTKHRG